MIQSPHLIAQGYICNQVLQIRFYQDDAVLTIRHAVGTLLTQTGKQGILETFVNKLGESTFNCARMGSIP